MLPDLVQTCQRVQIRRDLNSHRIAQTQQDIANLTSRGILLDKVSATIRALLDAEILDGVKAVERLQTDGLATVFHDQKLSVRAEITEQRGKVSVSLVTSHERPDGLVIEGNSTEGFGGAVTTVQSILLRLTLILQRGLRPLLLLDETLPAFDSGYVHDMSKLLSTLAKRLGLDILLVTHNQALVDTADRAYRIKGGTRATFHEVTK